MDFGSYIDKLPLIMMQMNSVGTIVEVSLTSLFILGWKADHFLGKNFAQLFGFLEEVQQEGSHFSEQPFFTESGEKKYFSWQIVSLGEEKLLAIGWEMSLYKKKCDEMLLQKREAEAASQAKTDFIAHTSHELRTPLNAVIGYSEMLLDEIDEADPIEVKHDLEKINTAAKHLLALINSVLDLSKIEAGKMELFNEEFDLAGLLVEVSATIDPLAKKKHNQLAVSYPEDLGNMYADRTKLREILFNLLSNATKFTSDGTIFLRAKIDGQEMVFEVEDNGCGMSPEEQKKLFVPYSQVGIREKKQGSGTGLGLMLCKKFAEMMAGSIDVKSELNKGTIFSFRLPLIFKEIKAEKVRFSDVVLVIDDDPSVHEIIQHVLKKQQLKILSAFNGEEGLKLARESQPFAIILDLMMPIMDGWEVLAKLKEDPALQEIPVVICSVDDGETRSRLAIKVDEYLVKPINSQILSSVLNRYRAYDPDKHLLLVVDDDQQIRKTVTKIAKDAGWTTLEAENGDLALKSLQREKPSLILLDLMMPVMNGFEFVHQFRKQQELKSIPIVVLTSKDLTTEEKNYLGGFAHRVIEKGGHEIDELQEIIQEIGHHR